ncbi:MAG: hypothetical protein IE938_19380 [Pseudomonas balearica]|nr:hypothetical protein [Stutzerimonas balearica]
MSDPKPIPRLTNDEMMIRAARGLGKVDLMGKRGLTLVNTEEIEAMAGLLAAMGLIPIYPGEQPTMPMFISTRKKPDTNEET